MNNNKNIIFIIVEAISGFGSLLLFFLNWYISVYPDVVREKVGDRVMKWLLDLPLPIIALILVFIFVGFLIFAMWNNGLFHKKTEVIQLQPVSKINQQIVNDNGVGLQNPKFYGPVTISPAESKKKDELVPSTKELAYRMGQELENFERKFESVRNAGMDTIEEKYNDTQKEIVEMIEVFLPNVKLVFNNFENISKTIYALAKQRTLYGIVLGELIHQKKAPYDSEYMKTGGQEKMLENEISLRTDNGAIYSKLQSLIVLLRKQIRNNL